MSYPTDELVGGRTPTESPNALSCEFSATRDRKTLTALSMLAGSFSTLVEEEEIAEDVDCAVEGMSVTAYLANCTIGLEHENHRNAQGGKK